MQKFILLLLLSSSYYLLPADSGDSKSSYHQLSVITSGNQSAHQERDNRLTTARRTPLDVTLDEDKKWKKRATCCGITTLLLFAAGWIGGLTALIISAPKPIPCRINNGIITGTCCATVAFTNCTSCPDIPFIKDGICLDQTPATFDQLHKRALPLVQKKCGKGVQSHVDIYSCADMRCYQTFEYQLDQFDPQKDSYCNPDYPKPIPPH